jgi:hypothetical protein
MLAVRPARTHLGFGGAVSLQAEDQSDESDAPTWVQIAREGQYLGYMGGLQPFEFTRAHFDEMVRNLRTNPAYKMGASGKGDGPVVPWDFNHASEIDPTMGSLPATGAPAQAWTYDLEARAGADGKAELWALTKFLEPAKTYIRDGKFKWSSVAVTFDATHPETGKNIGAILTSIALTNTPFIEGMQELAATRGVRANYGPTYYGESADGPEAALQMIRGVLGIAQTADVTEVGTELDKLAAWAASGEAPAGIDLDYLTGCLRRILNLPTLTATTEVVSEAKTVIEQLQPEPATTARRDTMDLIKMLASLLNVEATQEKVLAAINSAIALRAKAETDGSEIRAKLKALAEALGVADAEAGVEKIAQLMDQAKQLAAVMPELDSLKAKVKQQDDMAAEAEVDAVINARKFDPSLKSAMLMLRKADPEAFVKQFPKPAAGAGATSLTTPIATTPTGGELRLSGDGTQVLRPGPRAAQPGNVLKVEGVVNLSAQPGVNATQRAMAYLRAHYPGWDKLTFEEQFVLACNFKKQPNVVDQAA